MKRFAEILSLCAMFAVAGTVLGQEAKPTVVSNVKVLSDKVADVSSLEAWKKSFIKDGASDKDKAMAVFNSVVSVVHEDSPPRELLN